MFKTPNSGLTYFDHKGTLAVYKTHDRDPVVWRDGMSLVFRVGEVTQGCGDCDHCPNQFCPPNKTAVVTDDASERQLRADLTRRGEEMARELQRQRMEIEVMSGGE
jgi:hypothetical protein